MPAAHVNPWVWANCKVSALNAEKVEKPPQNPVVRRSMNAPPHFVDGSNVDWWDKIPKRIAVARVLARSVPQGVIHPNFNTWSPN